MNVSEIMTKNPATCSEKDSLQDVAKMMVDNDCGCIPVIDEAKKPVGMVTDRDITIRTVAKGKNPLDLTAGDAMTKNATTVTQNSSVEECCNLMEQKQIRRIAVVDEKGACCGIIAQADVATKTNGQKVAQVVQEVSK